MRLVEIGRKEADDRKMGSTTENTDCHQQLEHYVNINSYDDGDYHCCFSGSAHPPSSTSTSSPCPLRRRINNDQEDGDNSYYRCDSKCPSNYHANICVSPAPCLVTRNSVTPTINCDSSSSYPNDITPYTSFNNSDNCISRCSTTHYQSSRGSSSCSKRQNCRRIRRSSSNSISFLTRPCALYLFTVLVILDFSDFSSSLITSSSNSRRTSEPYDNVARMSRNVGFLVNGAMNNKNGQYGLGGLTVSPEVPILSMDSVFFDDSSIGNRLTGFSDSDEEGEESNSEEEEDGGNQIEISRTVEPQMLKRLESQFLKLFGMAKRPQRAQKKQIKIPKYLLDLYQKQSGTELPTSDLNLPGRHTRTANTVRTFYQQPGNSKEPCYPWKGRENHIKFNLDSIPQVEKVTGAELRIPFTITVSEDNSVTVNSDHMRESSDSSGDNDGVDGGQVRHHTEQQLRAVRILLHDIMRPATNPKSKKPKETHLLEPITYPIDTKSVVLSKRRNGTSTFWLTFDVFPAVARWMSNPKANHGLVLEILGVTNEGHIVPQETVIERHNLRVKRDVDEKSTSGVGDHEHHDGKRGRSSGSRTNSITTESSLSAKGSSSKSAQHSGESSFSSLQTPTSSSSVVSSSSPTEVGVASDGFINSNENKKKAVDTSSSIVLFTYSDDGHNPVKTRDAKTLSRHYRSAQNQKRRKNHRNKNRKRNLCQRHAMFVDFQDVGWNDWIVAPPGYAAYYCSGECPFPMAEHLNATNHAVIQALVHSMNPGLVPPPCCVPTKYSSLSLLYTDSSDKIVLKKYNEMIVDSCGCS